jgi:hypothetical protein
MAKASAWSEAHIELYRCSIHEALQVLFGSRLHAEDRTEESAN